MTVVIDSAFDPVPSLGRETEVRVTSAADIETAPVRAILVPREGDLPDLGLTRETLAAAGSTGSKNQTLLLPGTQLRVLVGVGGGITSAAGLRDAIAAFTRAAHESASLAIDLSQVIGGAGSGEDASATEAAAALTASDAALAATEGALLARYRYDALKSDPKTVALERLLLGVANADETAAQEGVNRAVILARTAGIARDLANTPPRHLSAEKFAEVIERVAPDFGLEVEVFDRAALMELGCGGLLGVNAGSIEEPRMIKVSYRPADADGHLALIGKGIMYDSGGISLKPSNAMHAAMKFDMMGAAAVFSSMTALRELGATTAVTGWLMCTDNMPSGSATKLGDVLTIRGGKTVEVKNTDAEGRLVMADGLVLATEEAQRPDAIVDIATLTGAAMMALGTRTAAMLANNDAVATQLEAAADITDENIWRFPLDHRYRDQLKSNTADLSNIGGQYAGVILAGLFLNEFVDGLPWGHLDIAGTMQAESDDLWRSVGSTGFGARLLAEFAVAFEAPAGA